MRIIVVLLLALAGCVGEQTLAQVRSVDRFHLTWTRENGWGAYCVLEVSGSRENTGGAKLLCHNTPRGIISSRRVDIKLDAQITALPTSDIERLKALVSRADLFGGRYVGRDARGGDGDFDTLKVWVNQPTLTAVLVTSGNGSFTGGDEARTELLQALACVEERLRARVGQPPPKPGKCPTVAPR